MATYCSIQMNDGTANAVTRSDSQLSVDESGSPLPMVSKNKEKAQTVSTRVNAPAKSILDSFDFGAGVSTFFESRCVVDDSGTINKIRPRAIPVTGI